MDFFFSSTVVRVYQLYVHFSTNHMTTLQLIEISEMCCDWLKDESNILVHRYTFVQSYDKNIADVIPLRIPTWAIKIFSFNMYRLKIFHLHIFRKSFHSYFPFYLTYILYFVENEYWTFFRKMNKVNSIARKVFEIRNSMVLWIITRRIDVLEQATDLLYTFIKDYELL